MNVLTTQLNYYLNNISLPAFIFHYGQAEENVPDIAKMFMCRFRFAKNWPGSAFS